MITVDIAALEAKLIAYAMVRVMDAWGGHIPNFQAGNKQRKGKQEGRWSWGTSLHQALLGPVFDF